MSETSSTDEQMSNIGGFNIGMAVTNFFGENRLKYGLNMLGNTTKTLFTASDTITDYSTEFAAYTVFRGVAGRVEGF